MCLSPGISRLQRWERAQLHGLNPPPEVRETLLHTDNHPQLTLRWTRQTCTYIDTHRHQVQRWTDWKCQHTQDTFWWWCIFSIMKYQYLLVVYRVIHTIESQQYHLTIPFSVTICNVYTNKSIFVNVLFSLYSIENSANSTFVKNNKCNIFYCKYTLIPNVTR